MTSKIVLHPLRIPLHWATGLTCGDCAYRQRVEQSNQARPYSRCMRPVEVAGQITYPYKNRQEVTLSWPACIAHKAAS